MVIVTLSVLQMHDLEAFGGAGNLFEGGVLIISGFTAIFCSQASNSSLILLKILLNVLYADPSRESLH